ncbi:hypothetical protein PPEP_a4443 [Pseudoalteromonas peptidolytica F12-50-A1]|uniref:Uncharacterized protein n=1 Tax=Pseudoalteromonas peptidolytica F12-50-A1 TaxID=1315280 RepID=A0A8I0T716_9GAMM|nr:hypothetical protein [Pseudoalteromonas peptidolytica F12-50-A1]
MKPPFLAVFLWPYGDTGVIKLAKVMTPVSLKLFKFFDVFM